MSAPMKRQAQPSSQAGFSLIELIVGMGIGLLCTLVIATVLSVAEGQRRGTSAGSDAQIAGSLALYAIQREAAMAGYGFASEFNALGCPLQARFGGAAVTVLPPVLAPVIITRGAAADQPDQLRVVASSKAIDNSGQANQDGYSLPVRLVPRYYDPTSATLTDRTQFNLWSTQGIRQGDLMVLVVNANTTCSVFQASADPAVPGVLTRTDDAQWNAAGFPATAGQGQCLSTTMPACTPLNDTGSMLVNMGNFVDVIFSVNANNQLVENRLNSATRTRVSTVRQGGIVMLKAMYGRDTDNDFAVDRYDYTAPTNADEWARVLAVRLVLVARSAQYERDEVTTDALSWDVGSSVTVEGSAKCGDSMCLSLPLTGVADWKHYRYKLFDTVVPLRNQRWKS